MTNDILHIFFNKRTWWYFRRLFGRRIEDDQKLFLDMFQHSTFIHDYEEFVFIKIPQDHSRNNLNFAMAIRHVCTMWDFRHMWECHGSFLCNWVEHFLHSDLFFDLLVQGQTVSAHCVISFLCVVTKKRVSLRVSLVSFILLTCYQYRVERERVIVLLWVLVLCLFYSRHDQFLFVDSSFSAFFFSDQNKSRVVCSAFRKSVSWYMAQFFFPIKWHVSHVMRSEVSSTVRTVFIFGVKSRDVLSWCWRFSVFCSAVLDDDVRAVDSSATGDMNRLSQ